MFRLTLLLTTFFLICSSDLHQRIDQQWQDLPSHYRLTTSLKDCPLGPFSRDFLAGARLEYLHTHFLLGFLSQRKVAEPDEALLKTASEMLSIVVEIIILRDRMANSGTCLIWKVNIFYNITVS
jgi:hypothetical protein